MAQPLDFATLAARRDEMRQLLAAIGDLRAGSLAKTCRKGGIPIGPLFA